MMHSQHPTYPILIIKLTGAVAQPTSRKVHISSCFCEYGRDESVPLHIVHSFGFEMSN